MSKAKETMHLIDPDIKSVLDGSDTNEANLEEILEESYLTNVRNSIKMLYSYDVREQYDVELEEVWIPNLFDDYKVRAIIIKPKKKSNQKHPLIFSVHYGGMTVGAPEENNEFHATLAQNYNFIGVSVDYHLAPEYHQPAQLHDLYSGIKWCVDNAVMLNIDAERIAIAGLSAGAGLAGGLALYIRDRKEFSIQRSFSLDKFP